MYEHELSHERVEVGPTVDRVGPEWAEQATSARQQEWSSDRALDQGDSHDKGEESLCVGEAA
jgi:hypothetical protein